MKFETLSLVAGTKACNAHCPYCCAQFTAKKEPVEDLDTRNLEICIRLANRSNINTTLITGWGEPTLYMNHIEEYCNWIRNHSGPPLIELQTNGIRLLDRGVLDTLKSFGVNTISISCVSRWQNDNKEIFSEEYISLVLLLEMLKGRGFTTRLTIVGLKGFVDSPDKIKMFSDTFTGLAGQVTWKPVVGSEEYNIPYSKLKEIEAWASGLTKLYELPYGGTVYDYDGQNICITNCLTNNTEHEIVRQLIYLPNGRVTYDWQYEGALILA